MTQEQLKKLLDEVRRDEGKSTDGLELFYKYQGMIRSFRDKAAEKPRRVRRKGNVIHIDFRQP